MNQAREIRIARCLPAVLLAAVLALAGCSSGTRAPVVDIGSAAVARAGGQTHRVNEGETLYAIAWMHDLDYNALARANNISSPYTIYPGQILTLETGGATATSASADRSTATRQPAVAARPAGNSGSSATSTGSGARSTGAGNLQRPLRWNWPVRGDIIASFSMSGAAENKGIDIGGNEGDPVLAAEAGEVVYAGSGLLRYGDLIIIKHSDQFLSAYAHNSRIDVDEGDRVDRGQQIAALGSTGVGRNMLHFEIRVDGNPVDPLEYLPPR